MTWKVEPSVGPYRAGVGEIGMSVCVEPFDMPVSFGWTNSRDTVGNTPFMGHNVMNNIWGEYIPTPSSPGVWYACAQTADGHTIISEIAIEVVW